MAEEPIEKQIFVFKKAFALFDKDGRGSIASNELRHLLQALGENPTDIELQDMANEMNPTGNDRIYLHEFLELMWNKANREKNEIREAFCLFDKNGDGYISADELRQVMAGIGQKLTDDELEAMIREADKDGDGKVNEEEFLEMMLQK